MNFFAGLVLSGVARKNGGPDVEATEGVGRGFVLLLFGHGIATDINNWQKSNSVSWH